MSNSLRLTVIALIPSFAVAAAPALAGTGARQDRASRQESIGVTTGFALGAVAGGPIGAILGGAAGGWLGDRYHRERVTNAALNVDLQRTAAERDRLAGNVSQLREGLEATSRRSAQLDTTLEAVDEIGMDVSFRTDDAAVSTASVPPLLKLGALTAALPEASLHVDGYADPRGSPEANQALSERRARAVADILRSAGLAPERIVVNAHGAEDCSSDPGDLDAYAFDRRVTVRLERGASAQATAATRVPEPGASGGVAPQPGVPMGPPPTAPSATGAEVASR